MTITCSLKPSLICFLEFQNAVIYQCLPILQCSVRRHTFDSRIAFAITIQSQFHCNQVRVIITQRFVSSQCVGGTLFYWQAPFPIGFCGMFFLDKTMKKRRFCSRLREGHPSRAHRTPIHTLVSRIYSRAQVKFPCLTILEFYLRSGA